MKALHPLAMFMVAAFALCATLALGADLGRRDAAVQFAAQGAPVLQVYARGDTGSPVLDQKAVAAFRTVEGVRSAVAIAEIPVALSGPNYTLPATVYAVPEEELPALSLPLALGALPDSAWRAQSLCGAELARRLNQTAGRLPGSVRLSVKDGGLLDVQLSAVAQTTGTVRDNGLWLDAELVSAMLPEEQRHTPLPVTRAEVEARSVTAAQTVANALRKQGFLAENPAQEADRTLQEGTAMVRQWSVLAVLALAGCVGMLWRYPPKRLLPAVLASLGAAALGVALAAVLMQTAMLLGSRFFLSADARYLLNAPRLLAVAFLVTALPAVRWQASTGR